MPCRIGDVGHDCRAQLLDLWYNQLALKMPVEPTANYWAPIARPDAATRE
jgi:hypothetical protein